MPTRQSFGPTRWHWSARRSGRSPRSPRNWVSLTRSCGPGFVLRRPPNSPERPRNRPRTLSWPGVHLRPPRRLRHQAAVPDLERFPVRFLPVAPGRPQTSRPSREGRAIGRADPRRPHRFRRCLRVAAGTHRTPGDRMRVNRKRIERIMRERRIIGRHHRRRCRTTVPDPAASPVPDLIKRDFTAPAPDTRWVGDITYLPVGLALQDRRFSTGRMPPLPSDPQQRNWNADAFTDGRRSRLRSLLDSISIRWPLQPWRVHPVYIPQATRGRDREARARPLWPGEEDADVSG